MPKYSSFNEAYLDLLKLVVQNGKPISPRSGSSLGGTRELLGVEFSVPSTRPLCTLLDRHMSYAFVFMEPFYLFTHQGRTDIAEALMTYAPNLKALALNPSTFEFDGNYGDRIHLRAPLEITGYAEGKSQLLRCYELLKKDPSSRRAVVTIHNPAWDIIHKDSMDIPCTLNLQFILRDGKLHCFCQMRSNDVWYGTPHNVMMFTFLQRALAGWLGVESGDYHHKANSFHIYEKHVELAERMTDAKVSDLSDEITYPTHIDPMTTYRVALDIIRWERKMREAIDARTQYPPYLTEAPYEAFATKKVIEALEKRQQNIK